MKCKKCSGRVFLDRVFTENKNFELYCVLCGDREFVNRDTELGLWLDKKESDRLAANILAS